MLGFGSITGGELLVRALVDQGIRHVFSIIGGQMATIYEAIRVRPAMKIIGVRREASAALMACGYVAATGTPAISMATVGAGVVYEVAGLANAWYNYLPVISIAPQVQSWKMKPHQENLQACNQDEIFEPLTKWNAIAYSWQRIPQLVNRAFREALTNAPGPVHLDIPVDVLFETDRISRSERNAWQPSARKTRYAGPIEGSSADISRAAETLATARRPLALIGQGMGRSGRFAGFQGDLNRLGIPTLLTAYSSGIMNGSDAAFVGYLSAHLEPERKSRLVNESDLLLMIGMDSESLDVIRSGPFVSKPLIQVELDPCTIEVSTQSNLRPVIGVNADPISFLRQLRDVFETRFDTSDPWKEWLQIAKSDAATQGEHLRMANPDMYQPLQLLADKLQDTDLVVVDGSEVVGAAAGLLPVALHGRCFFMDVRNVAGAGLPFAIGAKIGVPGSRVILACDKDSLFRHLMEMQTAVANAIDIRIICIDPPASDTASSTPGTDAILKGFGVDIADSIADSLLDSAPSNRPRAFVVSLTSRQSR